jgi:hypothetical protein
VSSAPIACASVLVSLFLSAPMALGTAHIHLLDTESFSDYSPPIELSGLGHATAAEEVLKRADLEMKQISRQGKTESASDDKTQKALKGKRLREPFRVQNCGLAKSGRN